jgi:hypothetical protein
VVPQLGKEGQFQVPGEIGVGLYTLGTMQGTWTKKERSLCSGRSHRGKRRLASSSLQADPSAAAGRGSFLAGCPPSCTPHMAGGEMVVMMVADVGSPGTGWMGRTERGKHKCEKGREASSKKGPIFLPVVSGQPSSERKRWVEPLADGAWGTYLPRYPEDRSPGGSAGVPRSATDAGALTVSDWQARWPLL